jgi:hypothetical protein
MRPQYCYHTKSPWKPEDFHIPSASHLFVVDKIEMGADFSKIT